MKYGTYHAWWFVTEKFDRVEINNNFKDLSYEITDNNTVRIVTKKDLDALNILRAEFEIDDNIL